MIKNYRTTILGDGVSTDTAWRPYVAGQSIFYKVTYQDATNMEIETSVDQETHDILVADENIQEV